MPWFGEASGQQNMNSQMFKLNLSDLAKGAVVALIGAILMALEQALTAHGLDLASYDWGSILNMGIVAGVGYLTKNFMSDSQGKVLGKIG